MWQHQEKCWAIVVVSCPECNMKLGSGRRRMWVGRVHVGVPALFFCLVRHVTPSFRPKPTCNKLESTR